MPAYKTDFWGNLEPPIVVLSTRYHKSLGILETIDTSTIAIYFNMSSAQEISFDVYKELDGVECVLWDSIVDLKYIYVPEYQEYFEIAVTIDEDDKTVKHVNGTSACEAELSQRKLRNFECNTETDILREDYSPTVLYDATHPDRSLLNRVLADKCPDYSIEHVDSTIANIQRTFSTTDTDVYSFLTSDVAEEIGCLFVFDSVGRTISAYDLRCNCNVCGYRGEFTDVCPKCGSTNIKNGYGLRTNVFISAENFADSISLDGDEGSVKNCFKIEGGDDLMTATVANINPNNSEYIFSFSELMKEDMPDELTQKIADYDTLYQSLLPSYEDLTEHLYENIDEELYLQTEMMPTIVVPDTTAAQELSTLESTIINVDVAVTNIGVLSNASADLAVNGMAKVIIDSRYTSDIISSSLSEITSGYRTWSGKFKVKAKGLDDDVAESVADVNVKIVGTDYEKYLYQKIQKTIAKKDVYFDNIFKIEDMDDFKEALTYYALDSLKSFESSYQSCIEVLIDNGVTDRNSVFFDVNLYEEMYVPYYNRILAIQDEMVVRENAIKVIQDDTAVTQDQRQEIQDQLDFKTYLGNDLWLIFCSYLREDTYSNSNYISDGLSNAELIAKAKELFEVANTELIKARELQVSLTMKLSDLLSTKEFEGFKQYVQIGNWIICKIDDTLYRLRIINLGINYSDTKDLDVTFSNVIKLKDGISDVESVISQAKSIASSYDYVAHQASQGNKAKVSINTWVDDGLSSALVSINNGENQEIVIDEHGLTAKSWDDILGDYLPEQMKLTSNILAFTEDNWETCSLGLGKHEYTYYDTVNADFAKATGYGLSAKFVQSAYVYGSQIIGGDIYSTNYDSTHGTYINLDDGTFSFGGGKLTYDGTDLTVNGIINASSGVFNGTVYATDGSFNGTITSVNGSIGGWTIKDGAIYYQTSSIGSQTPGIYIGTNGILNYKDSTHYTKIQNGVITAVGANFTGAITGSSFTASGHIVKYASNYTQADVDRIKSIILGQTISTTSDMEKYDFNQDGVLTIVDLTVAKKLSLGQISSYTLDTSVTINPLTHSNVIETAGVAIRANGITTKTISINDGLYVNGNIYVPSGSEDSSTWTGITGEYNNPTHFKIIKGIVVQVY